MVNTARFDQTFTCGLIPTLAETIRTSKIPIKALLLTNPHNPFGQCYPKHVLEGCARFCQDHDIHLISDEVYALSTFDSPDFEDPVPFMSALSLDLPTLGIDPSRVHVIWSISKDFGSSGLRMVRALPVLDPNILCVGTTHEKHWLTAHRAVR